MCDLTFLTGPCRGYFSRYGYDTSQKKCVTFIYGGCQGNGNNFKSEEECIAKCSSSFFKNIFEIIKKIFFL